MRATRPGPVLEKKFSRTDFELLAERFQPKWLNGSLAPSRRKIDAEGFWPDVTADSPYCWSPIDDLDPEIDKDCTNGPALPFPFTARQLAAFFLDGHGASWCQSLGGWDGDPAISLLGERRQSTKLDDRRVHVLHALNAAWAAYHATKAIVGELSADEQRIPGPLNVVERMKQSTRSSGGVENLAQSDGRAFARP